MIMINPFRIVINPFIWLINFFFDIRDWITLKSYKRPGPLARSVDILLIIEEENIYENELNKRLLKECPDLFAETSKILPPE
jgi:hypothetical protein